jgi:hypothetical protein
VRCGLLASYSQGDRTLTFVSFFLASLIATIFIKRLSLEKGDEKALKARGKAWATEKKNKKRRGGANEDVEKGSPPEVDEDPASSGQETMVETEEIAKPKAGP